MVGRLKQSWCRYCRKIFNPLELLRVRNDTCDMCEQMLK